MSMVDAFTGWAEFAIIPNKTAEEVAKAFHKTWISNQAEPVEILHDGGKEFVNSLAYSLAAMYNIKTRVTSARHPQSNGKTERIHSPLKRYLTAFVREDTMDWEMFLHSFKLAHNTAINATTGKTPYEMTYGEHPNRNRPLTSTQRRFPTAQKAAVEAYLDNLKETIKRAREEAAKAMLRNREIQKQQYDDKSTVNSFEVGDRVLLHNDQQQLNVNNKLARKWKGPYVILGKLQYDNYWIRLEHQTGMKGALKVHINRLRPWRTMDDFDPEVNIVPKDNQHELMREAEAMVAEENPTQKEFQTPDQARHKRVTFAPSPEKTDISGRTQSDTTQAQELQSAPTPTTWATPAGRQHAPTKRRLSFRAAESVEESPKGTTTPVEPRIELRRSARIAKNALEAMNKQQEESMPVSAASAQEMRFYDPCFICGEQSDNNHQTCTCGSFLTPSNEYQEYLRQQLFATGQHYSWFSGGPEQGEEATRHHTAAAEQGQEEEAEAAEENEQQQQGPNPGDQAGNQGPIGPENHRQGNLEAEGEATAETGADSGQIEIQDGGIGNDLTRHITPQQQEQSPRRSEHPTHKDTPRRFGYHKGSDGGDDECDETFSQSGSSSYGSAEDLNTTVLLADPSTDGASSHAGGHGDHEPIHGNTDFAREPAGGGEEEPSDIQNTILIQSAHLERGGENLQNNAGGGTTTRNRSPGKIDREGGERNDETNRKRSPTGMGGDTRALEGIRGEKMDTDGRSHPGINDKGVERGGRKPGQASDGQVAEGLAEKIRRTKSDTSATQTGILESLAGPERQFEEGSGSRPRPNQKGGSRLSKPGFRLGVISPQTEEVKETASEVKDEVTIQRRSTRNKKDAGPQVHLDHRGKAAPAPLGKLVANSTLPKSKSLPH